MSGPSRRDVLMGGALLAGAAGAVAMTPRGRLLLLPEGRKLDDIVPNQLGNWSMVPSSGIVLPTTPGSLAARLYGDQLARLYESPDHYPVMLVIAYGAVQSDSLQLHRPEVCYSAVGYSIEDVQTAQLGLTAGAQLPVRELVARGEQRTETITYWTRIGDDLPTDGTQQRLVKLKQQWAGYIADGVLVRVSAAQEPSPEVRADLLLFLRTLVSSLQQRDLPVLLGRPLARQAAGMVA